jgi:hypothetical protein
VLEKKAFLLVLLITFVSFQNGFYFKNKKELNKLLVSLALYDVSAYFIALIIEFTSSINSCP